MDVKTMLKWLRRQKPWDQSMALRVWGGGLYWRNRRKTCTLEGTWCQCGLAQQTSQNLFQECALTAHLWAPIDDLIKTQPAAYRVALLLPKNRRP
eukprot:3393977-Amphidinium_carterae.1